MLPTYINQVILEYDKVFALKCKKFLFYQVFAVEKIILLIIQMDSDYSTHINVVGSIS